MASDVGKPVDSSDSGRTSMPKDVIAPKATRSSKKTSVQTEKFQKAFEGRIDDMFDGRPRYDPFALMMHTVPSSPSPTPVESNLSSQSSSDKEVLSQKESEAASGPSVPLETKSVSEEEEPSHETNADRSPPIHASEHSKHDQTVFEHSMKESDHAHKHGREHALGSVHEHAHNSTQHHNVASAGRTARTNPIPTVPELQNSLTEDIPEKLSDGMAAIRGVPQSMRILARVLHQFRDPQQPKRTILLNYATLMESSGLAYGTFRRLMGRLLADGYLCRIDFYGYRQGGSIYELGDGFDNLLLAPPFLPGGRSLTSQPTMARPSASVAHSAQHPVHHPARTMPRIPPLSSSSFSLSNTSRQLLQELDVSMLALEEPWDQLEVDSLRKFTARFPSLEAFQDYLDKAAAVVKARKSSARPIEDPVAFLFGLLHKGEQINPPPGWKNRRIRAAEEEQQRLEKELEQLRAIAERQAETKVEIFFYQLPGDEQARILAEAEKSGDNTVLGQKRRELRRHELIKMRMKADMQGSNG